MPSKSVKVILSYLMIFTLLSVTIINGSSKKAEAADSPKNLASVYFNVTKKYLHLCNAASNSFDFNIKNSVKKTDATYFWYVKADKGTPDAVSINKNTGIVTARKTGTAYIRCKITLADGTVLRPEVSVTVRNNITAVDISNLPEDQTIPAGVAMDFNRCILNTEGDQSKASDGITRWEIKSDSAGVENSTDSGIVYPQHVGSFQIRAVSYQSREKYSLWLTDKDTYSKYITAASQWYTIQVSPSGGNAVAYTQDQLNKALSEDSFSQITFSTTKDAIYKIPEGNYSYKTLIVDAPNSEVENKGIFKKILIEAIKDSTWIEYADGNIIHISDDVVSFVIQSGANVRQIVIDTPNSVTNFDIQGHVDQIVITQPAQVNLSGQSGNIVKIPISVEKSAARSKITSSIPLDLSVKADTDIQLHEGAEDTIIYSSSNSSKVVVQNDTSAPINVIRQSSDGSTNETVNVGESRTITDSSAITTPAPIPTSIPDTVAPIISLVGNASVNLNYLNTHTDAGVTINDNRDTHLSVVVTYSKDGVTVNSIDTSVPGTYLIHYNVSDSSGNHAEEVIRTVTIEDTIAAAADYASVEEDQTITIDVLSNDSDPQNDTLTINSFTHGTSGTVTQSGASLTYTPDANYNGTDSFTYTVSDEDGHSADATVSITVDAVADPPSTSDEYTSINEDYIVTIDVLSNDSDSDGDSLTINSFSQGNHGSVTQTESSLTYTPTANYNGIDSFTYAVSDGNGHTADATVTVTINPVNDNPHVVNDSLTLYEDSSATIQVLTNDSDFEGDSLTIDSFSQGTSGTITQSGASLIYIPDANYNGSNSFTYTVSDGKGGTASGTVYLTITPVNDIPIAQNDSISTAPGVALDIPVLVNDSDVDGDSLVVSIVSNSAGTSATTNPDYSVNFDPGATTGYATVTYTISDGKGGTATAELTIYIGAH